MEKVKEKIHQVFSEKYLGYQCSYKKKLYQKMCAEYSISAEQISQPSDKHSLKLMVTNTDCTSHEKSRCTYLKVTFVSSMDTSVVYSVKINFLTTRNISEYSEVQAIIKLHASLPL